MEIELNRKYGLHWVGLPSLKLESIGIHLEFGMFSLPETNSLHLKFMVGRSFWDALVSGAMSALGRVLTHEIAGPRRGTTYEQHW